MSAVVSVVVPSYNHARFIRAAISGILNQTFDDFEIIVVDDGSVDGSQEVLSEFRFNPKVRLTLLDKNVGACEAMNIAIRQASGEFIAVCNSDDVWENWKLERHVLLLRKHPEVAAIFSDVEWIDDAGETLEGEAQPGFANVFNVPNRSRFEWIRQLVLNGNCLCHPSVLIRKSVYREIGEYNNYLRQLPDLDKWIQLVQKHEILVLPEKSIRFRIHDSNTSKGTLSTDVRTINEHELILRNFFTEVSVDNFFNAFGWRGPVREEGQTFEDAKIEFLFAERSTFALILHRIAASMLFDRTCRRDPVVCEPLAFQRLNGARTPWLPLSGYDGKDQGDEKKKVDSEQERYNGVSQEARGNDLDGVQEMHLIQTLAEIPIERISRVSILRDGHVGVVGRPIGSTSTKALLQITLSRLVYRLRGNW